MSVDIKQLHRDVERLKTADIPTGSGAASAVGARVYNTSYATASSSAVAITFANESYDTSTFHDNSTNNTRMTIPSNGLYIITGNVSASGDSEDAVTVEIHEGSDDVIIESASINLSTDGVGFIGITTHYQMVASEYLQLRIAVQTVSSVTASATFSVTRTGS